MIFNKRLFQKAIIFSIVLHLVFLAVSAIIHVGRVSMEFVKTHNIFKVKSSDKQFMEPSRHTVDDQDRVRSSVNMLDASKSVDHLEKSLKDRMKQEKEQPKIVETWTPTLNPSQEKPLQEMVKVERELTPIQKTNQKSVPNTIAVLDEDAIKTKVAQTSSPEFIFDTTKSEEFMEMTGFAPQFQGLTADRDSWKSLNPFTKGNSTLMDTSMGFEDINQHLLCELFTYKDPADGQKYFQVRIRAGQKVDELKRVPKEMVFLVDGSLSIRQDRMQEFKEALQYALTQLNPDDVFNIKVFKDRVIYFNRKAVAPTPENIVKAGEFVSNIVPGEGTDTYDAILQGLAAAPEKIPSYLFLLSDGKASQGEIDSTRIIQEISRVNNGNKGIFAFSGGGRVNRYLLDFISYRNRGWSEYASKSYQINTQMMQMVEKLKEPVLLNVRYNLSGAHPKDVFPKILPDFFRNAEINIYGKYDQEGPLVLRFLAEREGKTHEMEVETTFEKAQPGDESIAKNWAYNKIYDTIGRLDDSSKFDMMVQDIQGIAQKFNIQTPYTQKTRKD